MKKQIKNALTPIQNTSLVSARGVSDDASLTQYIQMVQQIPRLTAEQEYEYAIHWVKNHDQTAAEQLVLSHLRLVVSMAYDFKNYGIALGDLIASGNMGLMQAVQKFDPERGFRFSTYAMFWVRAEMYETILNNWSIVKIGTSANQKRVFFNLNRAKRALGIMDTNLSDDQTAKIAKYLEVPESDVQRMATRMSARDSSLNAPMGHDSNGMDVGSNLASMDAGPDEITEQVYFQRMASDLLERHLNELTERERDIIVARRLTEPAQTLEMLAKKYNVSRERVRQIEERAFARLRDAILADANGSTNQPQE